MPLRWFRKKPAPPRHEVWITEPAKRRNVLQQIAQDAQNADAVIAVAHFSETIDAWMDALDKTGLQWQMLLDPPLAGSVRRRGQPPGRIYLLHTDLIRPGGEPQAEPEPAGRGHILHVLESHPLTQRYDVINHFAEALGQATVTHHVSLDDPLMRIFSGAATLTLLRRLGMGDDDSINHRMVDTSILRAQQKIASRIQQDQPAHSAEHWFQLNAPDLLTP